MTARRHLYLGLFFLAVIVVLAGYTLFLTEFDPFSKKITRSIYFSNTSGLREGDAVQVAGMRWGKVDRLSYDPSAGIDERITVRISLKEDVELHGDVSIVIKDATVLGGKVLAIEPGTPGSPLWPEGEPLRGVAMLNVLDSLGAAVTDLRDPLREAAQDIQTMVADAKDGTGLLHKLVYDEKLSSDVSAAADRITTTFDNAAKLSQDLVDGKGTFGKLFTDETLYNDLQSFLTDGKELLADAREGTGLLPKLLNDEAMAEDGRKFLENARNLTDGLEAGEGTLGRLFQDSGLADDLEQVAEKIAAGEGTLGRLISDPELYDDIKQILDDVKVTTANLREGNGTIGKLINDDSLYVELRRAMKTLTGSLEEAREAAPITTLVNTLFLGF